MADGELMSAEDLRSRLYNSLKEKGLLDALKSQLRNKLVSELQHVGLQYHFQPEPSHSPEGSLLQKASNSLVADHLRRCHYDYSLSVFLPECGLAQGQASQGEASHKTGFLWQLLCELAAICGHSCKDVSVQTDATRLPPPTSLEEQFRKLDTYYSTVGDEHKQRWMAVEERILCYQRQLEERSKHDLQLEIARFKENELARMRIEEREHARQEIDRIRREIEQTYRVKVESLSQRERHMEDKIKKEQALLEKEIYSERQSLLAEIDAVRHKETAMRHKEEINHREKVLWEERMKTKEELVKRREEAVRMAEIEYNQKLQDEIRKFKMEEESRLLEKTRDLDHREMRVRENERRLDEELRTIHDTKEDLRQKRKLCLELEGELSVVKHDLISARGELEQLTNRVREMVDYQTLKEDHAVQRRELDNLRMRIAEISKELMVERQKNEELLREMTTRASKPTPEVYLMQKEVEKVRNEMKQERSIFEHLKSNLEKRYQDEIDRNHELLRKFEEQTLQIEEMNREIRDLRQQLGEHHTALTNEVYRKAKPSVLNRCDSLCDLEADGIDPTLIRTSIEPELLFTASHGLIDNILEQHHTPVRYTTSRSEDYSYSSDIVEETKRRLRSLEREAENLEHHYQDFQYRMTAVHPLDEPAAAPVSLVRPHTAQTQPPSIQQQTPQHAMHISDSKLVSSTPAKQQSSGTARRLNESRVHEYVGDSSLLGNSMSTVQSTSPVKESENRLPEQQIHPGNSNARLGLPVVSDSHYQDQRQQSTGNISSATQEDTQVRVHDINTVSLDDAWRHEQENVSEKQTTENHHENREHQVNRNDDRHQQTGEEEVGATGGDKTKENDAKKEDQIDPTLLKYMEIVKQQKEKEQEIAKKTVDTWNKNRRQQDRSPSQSEDMSLGIDKSEHETSDGDFW
ncbi:hypothetical protein LSH36_7g09004 [Paralvinella palmiformis]|uniref:LisH domain-containing protein n=1 Tax=Paralvinella palmiformis TaxID=53620 RepID=A0AAD9KEL5_9ANNE|nr:hypothetical protein LSH36_7g09004 [Paralvinella palmiformis]